MTGLIAALFKELLAFLNDLVQGAVKALNAPAKIESATPPPESVSKPWNERVANHPGANTPLPKK